MPIPSIIHAVIIHPRSKTDVSNPDTHYGTLGRALVTHLKFTFKITGQELARARKFCLYGDPRECRKTYVDAIQQINGHTPFRPLRVESGSSHDLRQQLRDLVENGVEILFIISTTPFTWLTTLAEDAPTASLPNELPSLGALLVSRTGDRFELRPAFIPA